MKHKHYDMIVAKANNMDLVTLSKHQATGFWATQNDQGTTDFGDYIEYYLCPPEYTDVCLHWLNGGAVQWAFVGEEGWISYSNTRKVVWASTSVFMGDDIEFRIKPKKVKRFIVVDNGKISTYLYKHIADIKNSYGLRCDSLQIIEIEVEV